MLLVLGHAVREGGEAGPPGPGGGGVGAGAAGVAALGLLLAWALGLEGVTRQAVVVEAAMPTAVITTILALEFDVAPRFVTSVVVVTTLVSPLTVSIAHRPAEVGVLNCRFRPRRICSKIEGWTDRRVAFPL